MIARTTGISLYFVSRPMPYISNFCVIVPTTASGRLSSALRKLDGPSSIVPSTSWLDGSIENPASMVRHWPVPSKFSSESPIGSMILWQAAHTGLLRCSSIRSRTEAGFAPTTDSLRGGTFGGGSGGGLPRIFSRIHLPRWTGEVRLAFEVTSSMLPWPRRPRRASLGTVTRRKSGP